MFNLTVLSGESHHVHREWQAIDEDIPKGGRLGLSVGVRRHPRCHSPLASLPSSCS